MPKDDSFLRGGGGLSSSNNGEEKHRKKVQEEEARRSRRRQTVRQTGGLGKRDDIMADRDGCQSWGRRISRQERE